MKSRAVSVGAGDKNKNKIHKQKSKRRNYNTIRGIRDGNGQYFST